MQVNSQRVVQVSYPSGALRIKRANQFEEAPEELERLKKREVSNPGSCGLRHMSSTNG